MFRMLVRTIVGLLLGTGFSALVGTVPPYLGAPMLVGGFILLGAVALDEYRDPPRRLGGENSSALTFAVLSSPVPANISLYWLAGDDEASQFADDLHEVVQQAGWSVANFGRLTYQGTPMEGVVFRWANSYQGTSTLEIVMRELNARGFAATRHRVQGSTGSADILVHKRPRETFSAALRRAWRSIRWRSGQ